MDRLVCEACHESFYTSAASHLAAYARHCPSCGGDLVRALGPSAGSRRHLPPRRGVPLRRR